MRKFFYSFLIILYIIKKIKTQRIKSYDTTYAHGEKINIVSGTINSYKTQIPYDLYYLDICTPDEPILFKANLGEIILSGKSYETNYQLNINQTIKCKLLCGEKITRKIYKRITNLINKDYFINYYLDNLPVGLITPIKSNNKTINKQIRLDRGIPLGFIENNIPYIYNYYKINVELNQQKVYNNYNEASIEYNIIGFYIEPFSIAINDSNINENKCLFNKNYEKQKIKINEHINFYYDVNYIYTNTTYDERIDKYYFTDNKIHKNSIIISIIIISFLTIILIFIFWHSIKNETEIENEKVVSDEEINEYGWRNVAFDVFRCPPSSELLSGLLGNGIQLFIMIFYSLLFVSMGILRPRNGGSYFIIMTMMYVFLGIISGYISSRFYKMVNRKNWIKLSFISILFFPVIFIIILSTINLIYLKERSTTFVDFNSLFSLIFLWLSGAVPLFFVGTLGGMLQKKIELPCKINPVPSLILHETIPWYLRIRFAWIFTGFPSFFAVFVELFYIMDSLWKQNIYSLNKYLLSSIIVLIITSSEIAILFTYFNLCKGDYRWWWKSFLVGASPGLYILIFSIVYVFKMELIQMNSIILCLCFMTLISVIITIICGSFGLFFTFIFIRIIYSKININ